MSAVVLVANVEHLLEDVADGGIFLAELADVVGDIVADGGIVDAEGFGIDFLHVAGILVEAGVGGDNGVGDVAQGVLGIELCQLFVLDVAAGHEDGGRREVRMAHVCP